MEKYIIKEGGYTFHFVCSGALLEEKVLSSSVRWHQVADDLYEKKKAPTQMSELVKRALNKS